MQLLHPYPCKICTPIIARGYQYVNPHTTLSTPCGISDSVTEAAPPYQAPARSGRGVKGGSDPPRRRPGRARSRRTAATGTTRTTTRAERPGAQPLALDAVSDLCYTLIGRRWLLSPRGSKIIQKRVQMHPFSTRKNILIAPKSAKNCTKEELGAVFELVTARSSDQLRTRNFMLPLPLLYHIEHTFAS